MLAGIGMIILGIIMMILVAIWGVLYIPCGMVFGLITSTQWAKDLFADAGLIHFLHRQVPVQEAAER